MSDDGRPEKLLHEDITEQIIGAAFEVHRILGYGFLEMVYHQALCVELRNQGMQVDFEPEIRVNYKGVQVGSYKADLLVQNSVMVELKAAKHYCSEDEAQLLNELKGTGIRVGLLINFGRQKVEFKRFIF